MSSSRPETSSTIRSDAEPDALMDSMSLYLELPDLASSGFSELSASFSTPGARHRARLNHHCWQTMQAWLKDEQSARVKVWPAAKALPSIWEVVNGTVLQVGDRRWVLLPTAEMEQQELRIPQEWVDIPDWAGDYYLGIEVNEAEGYLRIWGYATHAQVKTFGEYDSGERIYALDEADLLHNVDALTLPGLDALTQSISSSTQSDPSTDPSTANAVSLAQLPLAQAENLIARLGAVTDGRVHQIFPRQALPFAQWGALLAHGGWRQQMYEQRQGLAVSRSVLSWLQTGVDELAQGMGWQRGRLANQMRQSEDCIARSLTLGTQTYKLRIFPSPLDETAWRFELKPSEGGQSIPAGTSLRLLTEDLQPFEHNADVATADCSQLYVDVKLESGEGIVWETDPTPDDYEREILRF